VADDQPTWSALLGIGITCAVILALGVGVGWLVDAQLGSSPIFLLVGLAAGLVGVVSYTVVQFRKYLN
jgi:F0F1-type ATP synthase assembly protein I